MPLNASAKHRNKKRHGVLMCMAESKVFTVQYCYHSGQAVPRGSHVRLNLQTRQREVKLGEHQILKYQIDGQR